MSSLYSTAVHEAAHAVIAVLTARGKSHGLAKNGVVTIDKVGDTLGSVKSKHSGSGKHRHERDIMVSLAGGIADCRVQPSTLSVTVGLISTDTENIIRHLEKLHPSFPLSLYKDDSYKTAKTELFIDKVRLAVAAFCAHGNAVRAVQAIASMPFISMINKQTSEVFCTPADMTAIISEPWFKTLGELTNRTSALLDKHWREIHVLANHLLEVGTITGPEAEQFIRMAA